MAYTTWGPDTCECRVTFDTQGETIVYISTVQTCTFHVDLSGPTLLSILLSENQSKNKMAWEILDRVPRLGVIVTTEDGGTTVEWAPGVQFNWSFVGSGNNRQLRIEVIADPPLTQQEKGQIRAATAGMTTTVEVV